MTAPLVLTGPTGLTATLYLGDCLEVLPTLAAGSVDAVVTDPPYGVQAERWDNELPPQVALDECLRVGNGPVVWFGAAPVRCIAPTMDYDPKPDRMLIWYVTFSLAKTAAHGMFYRWHPIWCWRLPKKQGEIHEDVIRCNQNGHNSWNHPGTKPLALMTKLVNAWGSGTVLDPFMGSGTTGVACAQAGRQFIGIEIDPTYFEIAVKRIREALAQPRLL